MKSPSYTAGETVWLIHLGQTGVITRTGPGELLYVELDGMEIPVFVSDVERPSERKEILPAQPVDPVRHESKRSLSPDVEGIWLAMVPEENQDGSISSFDTFLVNATQQVVHFDYCFFLRNEVVFELKKVMLPFSDQLLHRFDYDALNEQPLVELKVRDIRNENFEGNSSQKIKPGNFFNKRRMAPLLNTEAFCYSIPLKAKTVKLSEAPPRKLKLDPERLKAMMQDTVFSKEDEAGHVVEEAVEEIDLHIEVLAHDYRQMSNSEMMDLQLRRFRQALERAIVHRVGRLFVIHGVGKGKLKQEVHRILQGYQAVKSYHNDYNPRYGYGATEVILR